MLSAIKKIFDFPDGDGGITHKYCDQYENEGTLGVKWSGTLPKTLVLFYSHDQM